MKKNRILWLVIIYLMASLTFIWILSTVLIPKGFLIAGHDSGLALDSKAFLETRFYGWDERINFGEDNSLLFGSLTLHAIDYLTSLIAGVAYAGNSFNLFFWIALMFIAGFTFSYQLRNIFGLPFTLLLPYFVVLNFYIFQSLFIMERAKYSLVTSTLFFLAILIRFFDKRISLFTATITITVILSIFNGGSWLGLPLFGGLILITIVILGFVIISDILKRKIENTRNFSFLLLISASLFMLVNSYSLFPYLQTFLKKDYLIFQNTATHDSNKAWLDYISQGSSFINIFRMQGVPDWYETKFIAAPMHPFSKFYLENPLMLILGFLIPISAFASFIFVKNNFQKKIISVSVVIVIVSMVFMSASRSPWGFVYELFYNNIPGFLIFRSSFYKFGYAFFIAISVLMGFTISSIIDNIARRVGLVNKTVTSLALTFLVISGWVIYHQKLLSPDILNWREGFSTKQIVPNYVNDYHNYVANKDITQGRTLILPQFHEIWLSDGYDWGYWSLSTIHYSLTKEAVISNSSGLNQEERYWVSVLYRSIANNDSKRAHDVSERLGITHLLLKMDAIPPEKWSGSGDPEQIKKNIESFSFIKEERRFGQWLLYKLNDDNFHLFSTHTELIQLTQSDFTKIYPFVESKKAIIQGPPNAEQFIKAKIERFNCLSCVVEEPPELRQLIWTRLLPNSLIYPIKMAYENSKLNKISDPKLKLEYIYNLLLKRSAEVSAMFLYNTHEAYIMGNLKVIRGNLSQAHEIIQNTSSPENFEDAKTLLNNIENIKSLLVNISMERGSIISGVLKDDIYQTIWEIEKLKSFYDPVLKNSDEWAEEKVFEVDVKSLPYELYVDETSLPLLRDGTHLLPVAVINNSPVASSLNLNARKGSWIPLDTDSLKLGSNKVILKFPKPLNLFKTNEQVEINTPEGLKKCHRAITLVKPQKNQYLIKVKTDKDTLKFFSKIDTKNDLLGFLEWGKVITIKPEYQDEYLRFHYPVPSMEDPFSFYVCGEHQSLPSFKEIIIEELFSPELIGAKYTEEYPGNPPAIEFQRVNPTQFKVKVEASENSYILMMNQRYSPLWQVKKASTGEVINNKPFNIDLYATGWVMSSGPAEELVVEYVPQRYFYIGVIVSGVTFFVIITTTFIVVIKRRRK